MTQLPIDSILPDLQTALSRRHETVLEAPPGAGKTTRVPLALLDAPWLAGQKILMLEPRRLAARAAAERMAQTLGEKVGETVGYRVRLDTRVGPATRIEVVTEGILTRMLQADPSLDGVGLLIFDEFHERSLDADLGLALALQGRELFRDEQPLKLLVMSATLDGQAIAALLGDAPVVRSEGRAYPVDIQYGTPWQPGEWIEPLVCRCIEQALAEQSGSLLVFLPGQREIRRVQQQLGEQLAGRDGLLIAPLYGDLSLAEQRRAIEPAPAGQRKIVLATNIAETSLTIEGVRVVIDSGLSRQAVFDPNTGMTRLQTRRVSQAASVQRAGRAGRMEPGVCYRLWSEGQQQQLAGFTSAEMLQADLAPLALQLLRWGVEDPAELSWLDLPPKAAYQQALELLQRLGAVSRSEAGHYQLTGHGEQISQLPVHPRLAHLIRIGQQVDQTKLACDIAALLSERDPLGQQRSDLELRLAWLRGELPCERNQRGQLQRLRQQSQRFHQLCGQLPPLADTVNKADLNKISYPQAMGLLIASAYPDRIAQQRSERSPAYRLSNGRAGQLGEQDPLVSSRWLAVAQLSSRDGQRQDRIQLAAELDPALFNGPLAELVSERQRVEWDEQQQRLVAERQRRVGELVLASEPLPKPSAEARQQALLELVGKRGLGLLPWNDELQMLRARVNFLRRLDLARNDSSQWPDWSDDGLLGSLETWLAPCLDRVSHINHFAALDLRAMLLAQLPWPLPQQLDQLAPERLQVPSGSRVRIDYREDPPVLAVKLQEMFGCSTTPTVANGVALKLQLLSPARRPLQVTQDLVSFWANGYPQVQKDMKGRYPKHPWPDDPLTAPATAATKKRSG
ncbi:ATP-dependent helicase HrpB [Marinobacterium arenosum]|uniref:ATP-dependent helicase HrpB n=1 Tax=Marinobacterium arenosum TaxID=2862496 RepID=UPI001C97FDA5|nr:ATP-dependent helicase HrpB [Marinobacterium arenosum]MBY4677492.1 ATP-dependent helicase HrpB [Marinobacterium arenosum]